MQRSLCSNNFCFAQEINVFLLCLFCIECLFWSSQRRDAWSPQTVEQPLLFQDSIPPAFIVSVQDLYTGTMSVLTAATIGFMSFDFVPSGVSLGRH